MGKSCCEMDARELLGTVNSSLTMVFRSSIQSSVGRLKPVCCYIIIPVNVIPLRSSHIQYFWCLSSLISTLKTDYKIVAGPRQHSYS
jgi:hypothetical protein